NYASIHARQVHVREARFGFVRPGEGEVRALRLRHRGLRIQVTHVQRALDVVLPSGPRVADHAHRPRDPAAPRRADPDARLAVDDQLLGVVVPPDRGAERLHLLPGQELAGSLPDERRLGDVRIAVEGREVLGHRLDGLDWHGVVPVTERWAAGG